jgi:hypothetical protein
LNSLGLALGRPDHFGKRFLGQLRQHAWRRGLFSMAVEQQDVRGSRSSLELNS